MKTFNIVKRLVESFFDDIKSSDIDFDELADNDAVQAVESMLCKLGSIVYYHPDKGVNFSVGQPIAICVVEPGQLDNNPRYMMLNKIQTSGKNGISPKRFIFGGKVSALKNLKKYTYDGYKMHDKIYDMPCMKLDVDGEKNTNALLDMNDPANPYKAAQACVGNKIDVIYKDAKGKMRATKAVPARQYIPTAAEIVTAQDNLREILKSLKSEKDTWITNEQDGLPVFGGWNIQQFIGDTYWTSTCLSGNSVFAVYGSHLRWRLIECNLLTETHEVWPFIKLN